MATRVSEIHPTGYHGTELAQVGINDSIANYGAGPVRLMARMGVEAVGYPAHNQARHEKPGMTINDLVKAVRPGQIGVVGVSVPEDPNAAGELAKRTSSPSTWAPPL